MGHREVQYRGQWDIERCNIGDYALWDTGRYNRGDYWTQGGTMNRVIGKSRKIFELV